MTGFLIYLASILPALVVFVTLHKRRILRQPSPMSALAAAAAWPLVAAFFVAIEAVIVAEPHWTSLNEWWDAP